MIVVVVVVNDDDDATESMCCLTLTKNYELWWSCCTLAIHSPTARSSFKKSTYVYVGIVQDFGIFKRAVARSVTRKLFESGESSFESIGRKAHSNLRQRFTSYTEHTIQSLEVDCLLLDAALAWSVNNNIYTYTNKGTPINFGARRRSTNLEASTKRQAAAAADHQYTDILSSQHVASKSLSPCRCWLHQTHLLYGCR